MVAAKKMRRRRIAACSIRRFAHPGFDRAAAAGISLVNVLAVATINESPLRTSTGRR
jgi:hypothetical protein